MKLKVTNPTSQSDYGIWDLQELIKALTNPLDYPDSNAAAMKYDLSGESELEFEMIEAKKHASIPDVRHRAIYIEQKRYIEDQEVWEGLVFDLESFENANAHLEQFYHGWDDLRIVEEYEI